MPLSIFDHRTKTHLRDVSAQSDGFGHTFGGEATSYGISFSELTHPLYLLYRLNLDDPRIPIPIPGVRWLPLCYGFLYATLDGKCIYRVPSDKVVELVWPTEVVFDPDYELESAKWVFSATPIGLMEQKYASRQAEDALELAAVFGLDNLDPSQLERAIRIADSKTDLIKEWGLEGWAPEDIVRAAYPRPFIQGKPSAECDNPSCTAEVIGERPALSLDASDFSDDALQLYAELGISVEELSIPASPRRRPSLSVFAIHEFDSRIDAKHAGQQVIFQICDACQCITVTNQCD